MLTAIFLIGIAGALSAQKIAIIDAGSSGSRLYVYELDVANKMLYERYSKEGGALSGLVANDTVVRTFITKITDGAPVESGKKMQLYILATAGMRNVKKSDADTLYGLISTEARKLANYELKGAMTISGRYEGLYAWIAANFKNGKISIDTGTFGPDLILKCTPDSTCGILEIGGASMQIAFRAYGVGDDYIKHKGLGYIYSKSYLGGGVNDLYAKYAGNTIPYNFYADLNANLSDVKKLFPSALKFIGLGGAIGRYFENKKKHELNERAEDTSKCHPYMNAEYIKYVTDSLGLSNKFEENSKLSSWTEGAALDILLNKEPPEPYDYKKKN